MTNLAATELLLIRHAPAITDGCLAGRRDVAAHCADRQAFAALRRTIGDCTLRVISPALRCRQTAAALWPDLPEPDRDACLLEQDFGAWEGLPYAKVPDIGTLSAAALATMRPPGGESFSDQCHRVALGLASLARRGGRIAIVAHAGTARAALALALGSVAPALSFAIAPMSITALSTRDGHTWSIGFVNRLACEGEGAGTATAGGEAACGQF